MSLQTVVRTLNDHWRVREVPPPGIPPHNQLPWLPASVPGHVHLDLQRAGVIADPFRRLHERGVAWVDESDWEYETAFHVDGPAPACAFLRFLGLDTVATVMLNGELLGETDNMFVPHEFDVAGRLHAGEGADGDNTLRVLFMSARRVGDARHAAWGAAGQDTAPYHWDNYGGRAFVRKAQYMFGWDWGPVLRSAGLWRPVELVTVPVARLRDWKHDVAFTDDGKAIVTVTADVERSAVNAELPLAFDVGVTGLSNIEGINGFDVLSDGETVSVPAGTGTHSISAKIVIHNPRLWWPNGVTSVSDNGPTLYELGLTLRAGDGAHVSDDYVRIGLRTIELVQEPDADGAGEGFKFCVNGHDLFVKGANWIPEDSFPSRLENEAERDLFPDDDRVKTRILQAKNAGFNMLRVWGGGLYESEHFYDLCDAHGILVWQDFPYACAYYPDDEAAQEVARTEAVAAVKRIRNHASLALWCGNNENQMMWDANWTGHRPPRLLGDPIYHEVLPSVVAELDAKTPYWPTSPFGGPEANSDTHGDCHNWDVWHGRGDWTNYTENDARFCSEFGFAASCSLAAWDTVLDTADRHPQSAAVRWHDKTRKGYDVYLGYIAIHYPAPQTLEDLVFYSQLNQRDALSYGIEHYRRRKGHCWGTLFWQINDCWPVQSWSVIDSLGEPKAAYFGAKRFYAPVLVSLVRDGQTAHVHMVNDHLHALSGQLTVTTETFDSEVLLTETHSVSVGANGAEQVAAFDLAATAGKERGRLCVGAVRH